MNKVYILMIISCLFCNNKFVKNREINISRENAITYAIDKASDSVVGINVTQIKQQSFDPFFDPFFEPFFHPFFNHQKSYKVKNLGSGVIISDDGFIITNSHVVENASEIIVSSSDGQTYEATIIGIDELTDIALIKIEPDQTFKDPLNPEEDDFSNPILAKFSYSKIGNSDELIVGEWVIALGNPLGLFDISHQPTATVGIISGIGLDFGQKQSGKVYQDMLQTDASINPGNSGGPLVNVLGEIIGINTFIMTNSSYNEGSIGIGFAIPINRVMTIVEELREYGMIERNFETGLHVQKLDRTMKKILKIGNKTGVIITNIDRESSGEKAGLIIGDVILSVDGNNISNISDILKIINEGLRRTGDFISLVILRNDEKMVIKLELKAIN